MVVGSGLLDALFHNKDMTHWCTECSYACVLTLVLLASFYFSVFQTCLVLSAVLQWSQSLWAHTENGTLNTENTNSVVNRAEKKTKKPDHVA